MNTRDDKTTQLSRKIHNIYARPHSPTAGPGAPFAKSHEEFRALAEVNLGEGYDPEKIAALVAIQREMREKKRDLINRMKSGSVSPEAFPQLLGTLLSETALRCESILGPADFVRLFGIPADAAADLVSN